MTDTPHPALPLGPASPQPSAPRRGEWRGEFPPVPDDLLAALEIAFPDRCPDGALSNDEIRERIGEARVVRFLRQQRERQHRARVSRVL